MKQRLLVLLGLALFVLLNVWAFWYLPSTAAPGGRERERQLKVVRLRETWAENDSISLDSPDLPNRIDHILADDCDSLPTGAARLSLADLDESERTDLRTAVLGLLHAYSAGNPKAVVNYMRDRGETLDHEGMRTLAQQYFVQELGESVDYARGMSDEDVYVAFWSAQGKPEWGELIAECSCCTLWTLAAPGEDPKHVKLGEELTGVFGGARTWTHNFVPMASGTVTAAGNSSSRPLFADVALIIVHSKSLRSEPAPYIFRFTYNTSSHKWQPFMVTRAHAFDDAPIALPF